MTDSIASRRLLASQQKDETLDILARKVRDQGQKNIYLASEVMSTKR